MIDYFDNISLPTDVRKSLDSVSKRIASFSAQEFVNPQLYEPSVHLLKAKGKLLRPTLVLLGAHFLDQKPLEYVDLALSAELIHISSLIHDDIIDRDKTRRGVDTVHGKYGNEAAILAGDALISKAVLIASRYGNEVLSAMSDASMKMCAGELLDYNFQKAQSLPKITECLNIASLKSASLIATCCNIAAIHKKDARSQEMYLFGNDLGVAFQIRDDIIDYKAWSQKGREGRLIPNIVLSIEAEKGVSESSALIEAEKLKEKYVKSAYSKVGNGMPAKLLKDYADLIIMKV